MVLYKYVYCYYYYYYYYKICKSVRSFLFFVCLDGARGPEDFAHPAHPIATPLHAAISAYTTAVGLLGLLGLLQRSADGVWLRQLPAFAQ